MQGARLVNKGGKNQQKQKQTNILPITRKKLHSFQKERNKSCLCFDSSFIQSFKIKFKVKQLKNGHIFFSFASENLFSVLMSRKGAELSTVTKELIVTLSESVKNKAELSRMLNIPRTTITSVLRKYRRTLAQWRLCPEVAGKEASQIETEML